MIIQYDFYHNQHTFTTRGESTVRHSLKTTTKSELEFSKYENNKCPEFATVIASHEKSRI